MGHGDETAFNKRLRVDVLIDIERMAELISHQFPSTPSASIKLYAPAASHKRCPTHSSSTYLTAGRMIRFHQLFRESESSDLKMRERLPLAGAGRRRASTGNAIPT